MTHRPHVLHLIDDTTAGGVMRVLDHIQRCPLMAATARHSLLAVTRGKSLPAVRADVIVSHLTISWRALPALIVFRARHATTPIVHVEHSYTGAFSALNVTSKARFQTLLRTAYALFDRVVAVSEAQAGWMTARGLVSAESLQVIRPVVDLAGFRALARPDRPLRTIGAIGRLDRQKGFDVLIPAFRALTARDLRLDIYGEGPERAALEALAAGDPRIVFRGLAAPEQALAAVDVVAMPSRWEAFGLVALEARAAGRPLVMSGVDGLAGQATGETATVPSLSVADWTEALRRMLARGAAITWADPTEGAEGAFAAGWTRLIEGLTGTQDGYKQAS